jgi:hypothetical protein
VSSKEIADSFRWLAKAHNQRPLVLDTGATDEEKILALNMAKDEVTLWLYGIPAGVPHASVRAALIRQADGVVFVARDGAVTGDDDQAQYDRLIAELQRDEGERVIPVVIQTSHPEGPEGDAIGFRRLPGHRFKLVRPGDGFARGEVLRDICGLAWARRYPDAGTEAPEINRFLATTTAP